MSRNYRMGQYLFAGVAAASLYLVVFNITKGAYSKRAPSISPTPVPIVPSPGYKSPPIAAVTTPPLTVVSKKAPAAQPNPTASNKKATVVVKAPQCHDEVDGVEWSRRQESVYSEFYGNGDTRTEARADAKSDETTYDYDRICEIELNAKHGISLFPPEIRDDQHDLSALLSSNYKSFGIILAQNKGLFSCDSPDGDKGSGFNITCRQEIRCSYDEARVTKKAVCN